MSLYYYKLWKCDNKFQQLNCHFPVFEQAKMTSGSGDFLIANKIYPNKAYNDQDITLVSNSVVSINVGHIN